MPGNVVALPNSRKHWTNAEKEARAAAERAASRETAVRLVKPEFVRADPVAERYWDLVKARKRGIELLDNLDAETLGRYCCIAARLERLNALAAERGFADDDLLKRIEAAERNLLAYAEKLGLTPSGRARLAKRKAEKPPEDPDADLYGA